MSVFGNKEKQNSQNCAGLVIKENEFYFTCINNSDIDSINIVNKYTDTFTSEKEFTKKLSSYIYRNDLCDIKCNWVLSPSNYKLLLLDVPPVPESEQLQTLRWQAIEKADDDEENLLIDIMVLPNDSGKNNNIKAYAVVANKMKIINMASLIESTRLGLSIIDIPENALASLIGTTKYFDKSVAFIIKILGNLTLLVCKNKQLYLTRKLSLAYINKSKQENSEEKNKDNERKNVTSKLSISKNQKMESINQLDITKGSVKSLNDLDENKIDNSKNESTNIHAVDLLVSEIKRSFEYCRNSLFLEEPEYILYTNVPEISNYLNEFSQSVSQKVIDLNVKDILSSHEVNGEHLDLVALSGSLRYR